MVFDQSEYWKTRHKEYRGDPRSVGNLAADRGENEKGELDLKNTVISMAKLCDRKTVLDLGCGYGRIAESFTSEGYDYTGLDVSKEAISDAKKKNTSGTFQVADLNKWEPDHQYEMICMLYILVHFVDDNNWKRIFRMAGKALTDNGVMVIADIFPEERVVSGQHVVSRSIGEYDELVQSEGFTWDHELRRALLEQYAGVRGPAPHFRFIKRR